MKLYISSKFDLKICQLLPPIERRFNPDPTMIRPWTLVISHSPVRPILATHFLSKHTTFCALAISQNFTESASHKKWQRSKYNKNISPATKSYITTSLQQHQQLLCLSLATKSDSTPTTPNIPPAMKSYAPTSQQLRQILRLPRKVTRQQPMKLLFSSLPFSSLLFSTLLFPSLPFSSLLYYSLLFSSLLFSTLLYSTLLYSSLTLKLRSSEVSHPSCLWLSVSTCAVWIFVTDRSMQSTTLYVLYVGRTPQPEKPSAIDCKYYSCTIYIYNKIYEGCSKFFHVENVIFAKKLLSPNFSEPHVYL